MWPNPQETEDLITITEKIHNGKLYFLCSVGTQILPKETKKKMQIMQNKCK